LLGEDGEVGDGIHGEHHLGRTTANAKPEVVQAVCVPLMR
jgi:hypothetical protein